MAKTERRKIPIQYRVEILVSDWLEGCEDSDGKPFPRLTKAELLDQCIGGGAGLSHRLVSVTRLGENKSDRKRA